MAINQIPPIFMDEKIMFSSSDVNTYTARFGLQKPCCMTLRLKAQMEIKFAKYVPSIIFSKFCHFQNIMMDIHRILSIWNYHYLGKVNWNDGLGLKCIFWRDKTFCHLRLNLMKYIKCAYSCPSLDIYLVILKMQTSQVLRYISLIQMDCMIACDQYHWCFFQNLDFYEFCSVGLNRKNSSISFFTPMKQLGFNWISIGGV